jgi:alkanesulfonate monooxygenase SsuD/methylene tetrahydromethanopterin reductase-like flavin-dependent oxidoreductase (luciferase family)
MSELRGTWRRLEAAGLDWISAWDHFYEAPPAGGTQPHFEAIATLGALAADTTRPRLGCLVFYVGYRNPAALAKAARAGTNGRRARTATSSRRSARASTCSRRRSC